MGKYVLNYVEGVEDTKPYMELVDTESDLVVWSENEGGEAMDRLMTKYVKTLTHEQLIKLGMYFMICMGDEMYDSNAVNFEFSFDATLNNGIRKRIEMVLNLKECEDE